MDRRRRGRAVLLLAVAVIAGVAVGVRLVLQDDDAVHAPSTAAPAPAGAPSRSAGAATPPAFPEILDATAPPVEAAGGFLVVVTAAGRPVAGAEVRLHGRAPGGGRVRWESRGEGRTGEDGTVRLAAPPGPHLLTASAPGLARAFREVLRPSGEERTRVELRLAPGVTLSGRVVERGGGAAVPFAAVAVTPIQRGPGLRRLVLPAAERPVATTDAHGAFRVTGVGAGRYEVEARAVGHAPGRRSDVAVPADRELVVELAAAGTIEGIVTRDGKPVAGATVSLLGGGEPVTIDTGPGGGFAAEVEPGLHRAFATLGGETGSAGRTLPVAAGSTLRGVEIRLGPAASIAGRVRSVRGPVRGAVLLASLAGDPAGAVRAVSGGDGSYALAGLAPGTHALSVSAPGLATARLPGVNVRQGERFPLDVQLALPSAVEGLVTGPDGEPAGGALVAADSRSGPGPGRGEGGLAAPPVQLAAVADATGRYRLEGVSPGPVRVSARKDPSAPAAVRMVEVEEGETVTADLTLVEGGLVSGTVRDTAGNPVAGATVWVGGGRGGIPRPGEVRQATSDASGAFLLGLPPGSYALQASRPRGNFRLAGRPAPLATVQLAVGQVASVDLVLPDEPPPTLTGRVLEPGGVPSAGAGVWIGTIGPGFQAAQADGDGAFSLSPGAAARVQVNARNGGRTATVEAQAPGSDLVVQLQPAAVILGRLVGEPPPETFSVSVQRSTFLPGGSTPEQQFAGAMFELDDVVPGQVGLHVKTSDGRVGDAQVTGAAGATARVDVSLSPACTVTGRLVDAITGKPVTRARILVDGVASRRYGVDATGRFTRITSEGDHQLAVAAVGYAPRTVTVRASAAGPAEVGDVALTPAAPAGGR